MQRWNGHTSNASDFVYKLDRRADYSLKLDYNEMPYSPAWLGSKNGECLHSLNRYPEDDNQALIQNIARTYSLHADEIAVTHGIDEAVDRFIQLFPNHSFVVFRPTFFGFMDRFEANSATVRTYHLTEDFRIAEGDFDHISKSDVVIVASPNNPTGHVFSDSEIEKLLEVAGAVLMDETYIDYSSSSGWLAKRPHNLFVYRSFSKSFGLAGLRAGFLAGPSEEMTKIRKKQWFCNMSSPVIAAINKALESDWHIQKTSEIIQERERVTDALRRMDFEIVTTETNFILIKDSSGIAGETLDQHRIRVRRLSDMDMPDYVRVAIDTPANNDLLLQALSTAPSRYYVALDRLQKLNQEWHEKTCVGVEQGDRSKNFLTRKAV